MNKWSLSLVLLAAVSAGACGVGEFDDGTPQEVAKDQSGARVRLGKITTVEGTALVTVPVLLGSNGGGSYSYSRNDIRNRLIVNSETGESRRVLPNNRRQIVRWIEPGTSNEAPEKIVNTSDKPPSKLLYGAVVARAAAKGDEPRRYDVLLGRFDRPQQVWVSENLSGVQDVWLTPAGDVAMIVVAGALTLLRVYDPQSFQLKLEKRLSI